MIYYPLIKHVGKFPLTSEDYPINSPFMNFDELDEFIKKYEML